MILIYINDNKNIQTIVYRKETSKNWVFFILKIEDTIYIINRIWSTVTDFQKESEKLMGKFIERLQGQWLEKIDKANNFDRPNLLNHRSNLHIPLVITYNWTVLNASDYTETCTHFTNKWNNRKSIWKHFNKII